MIAFATASLLLLLSPGPTNTLMALAGTQGGLRRVYGLVAAEIAGYLFAILPLLTIGGAIDHRWPDLTFALKLTMAGWILFLAIRLWTAPANPGGAGQIRARRIFVTTMLNPKALVFALILLPAGRASEIAPRLGLLVLLIAGVALAWGSCGAALCAGAAGGRRRVAVQRAASIWLAMLSAMLVTQVSQA